MTRVRRELTLLLVVAFTLFLANVCSAQDKELRDLASSLSSQIKAKGKGPAAITAFVNPEYGPAFSTFLVDRLNILLARGNSDFDVVTRDRIEEAYKEINLSLGQNYNASTFARVGQHVGAKVLVTGSYAIQAAAAKVSLAVQLLDVETGRIIGGDVAELPYSGDIKAMLSAPVPTTPGGSSEEKPSVSAGPLLVRLVSIDKTRNGNQVQLVLSVRNLLKDTLDIALIPEELPVLLDNTGTSWQLSSQSGVNIDKPNGQIHVWTSLAPGADTILSFIFSGSASEGTSFTFTGAFISRILGTPYDPYNPPRVPIGLAGMRVR